MCSVTYKLNWEQFVKTCMTRLSDSREDDCKKKVLRLLNKFLSAIHCREPAKSLAAGEFITLLSN